LRATTVEVSPRQRRHTAAERPATNVVNRHSAHNESRCPLARTGDDITRSGVIATDHLTDRYVTITQVLAAASRWTDPAVAWQECRHCATDSERRRWPPGSWRTLVPPRGAG